MRRVVALLLIAFGLAACGTKGALYLRRPKARTRSPPRRNDVTPFAVRDGRLHAESVPLEDDRAPVRHARATSTRARALDARVPRVRRGARRPRPPRLLRGEGELEPRGARRARAPRRGLRHRLRRRARARARGRRRSGARWCSPASARPAAEIAPGARGRHPLLQRRVGAASSSASSASRREAGKRAPVSLRVNPDVDPKTHPYISTGLKENKFGVAVRGRAAALPHGRALRATSQVVGIDCHIGSQLTELAPFVAALDKALELVDALRARGHRAASHRHRRRPRHPLPRRAPAVARGVSRRRCSSVCAGRRAEDPARAGPRDRRQRRRCC